MLKIGKKNIIIISIAAAVVLIAAVTGFILFRQNDEQTAQKPPAYYFEKSDGIASVTDVLGERRFEKLESQTQKPSDPAESSSDAESDVEPASATAAESESVTETVPEGTETEAYRYYPEAAAEDDIKGYMDYLMTTHHFIDVTDSGSGSENNQGNTDDDPQESEKVSVYRLAGPSDDSACSLVLTIETDADSYIVTATRENTAWNEFFAKLWGDQKEELQSAKDAVPEETKATVQVVEEKVSSMSQEDLELPEAVENYTFIANAGLMEIDGINYYRVGAYKRTEQGTLQYQCAYLVDYSTANVDYRYFDATGTMEPLRRS